MGVLILLMEQVTDWEKFKKGKKRKGYQKEKRKEKKRRNSDKELVGFSSSDIKS